MARYVSTVFLILSISSSWISVHAVTIGFAPSGQTVPLGSPAEVAVTIAGLGDGAPPSLGVFDLDVTFDPGILGLSSVAFGDPVLGDQLDLFGFGGIASAIVGTGTVNLFELSLDFPSDLDTLQAGSFTLVTLSFDTLAVGTSGLEITVLALGDAFGDSLPVDDPGDGSITVAGVLVPEPAGLLLLVTGLTALIAFRRKVTTT